LRNFHIAHSVSRNEDMWPVRWFGGKNILSGPRRMPEAM
jgi:hypothetical protein